MQKTHFHSIDALRFFAFLKVYLLHVPIQGDFPVFAFLKSGGGIGVSFFFVLSGFLITYLLVLEKSSENYINLKKFFVRRALRIWPLFFLMVLIAFLLPFDFKQAIGFHMVGGGYDFDWRYSFTFLENYKMLMADNFPKTTPLPVFWSLCIEEHFYLLWMICMFFLPVKHIFKFLISCFFISWIARFAEPFVFHNAMISTNDVFTNLDCFAGGGMLGYAMVMHRERFTGFIMRIGNPIKWAVVLLVIAVVIFQKNLLPNDAGTLSALFRPTIIALLFVVLIAVFLPENSSVRIKSRLLSFLGVRSYGLYVYHIIVIHVSFQFCLDHGILINNWLILAVYMLVTLGVSVLLSALSYKYFEMPFLRLRNSEALNRLLGRKGAE